MVIDAAVFVHQENSRCGALHGDGMAICGFSQQICAQSKIVKPPNFPIKIYCGQVLPRIWMKTMLAATCCPRRSRTRVHRHPVEVRVNSTRITAHPLS